MSTSYPSSLDSYSTKNNGDVIDSSHVDNIQDAVTALETKLGADNSAVTTSIDYKLKNSSSVDPGHKHSVSGISATGSPSSTTFLRGDGAWATPPYKFGGTGSDGALTVTGTTTIDLGGAAVVTKNYTSISITGTGQLAFSNTHANGTIIILKSQGNVTITSSTSPAINASGLGSSAGNQGRSNIGLGTNYGANAVTTAGGTAGASAGFMSPAKNIILYCGAAGGAGSAGNSSSYDGSGGGGGGTIGTAGSTGTNSGGNSPGTGTPGTGGRGGGALYIECAGTYTCSSTISVAGSNGGNASGSAAGGGGGGAGGSLVIKYNTLGSDTGTYTVSGGTGGSRTGFAGVGGNGASGYSDVSLNTDIT